MSNKQLNWKPLGVNWQEYTPRRTARGLPVANADGDNCGTGAGGFKPGNTCGSKKGASAAVSRLVDYDAYSSHDSWWEPDGQGGRVDRTKPPSMGGLPPTYRTPEMNAVLKDSKTMIGRQPEFFNVSKRTVGLKYVLRPNEPIDKFQVFRDTLLDRGFTAEMTESNNHEIVERDTERAMQRYFPWVVDSQSEEAQRIRRQFLQHRKNYITITIS